MNIRKLSLMALIVASIVALSGCGSLPAKYVAADRATFDAVAPRYSAYLNADDKLPAGEKQSALDTVKSWETRLKTAEGK